MPYTTHGHWYGAGQPAKPGPRLVARCGGPRLCNECQAEAGALELERVSAEAARMNPEDVPGELLALAKAAGDDYDRNAITFRWEGYQRAILAAVLPPHEQIVLARIEALADEEPEPEPAEDSCSLVDIDGETARVHGSGELGEEGRQALGEVFRAARARMRAEKEAERAETEREVRAQIAAEIEATCRKWSEIEGGARCDSYAEHQCHRVAGELSFAEAARIARGERL